MSDSLPIQLWIWAGVAGFAVWLRMGRGRPSSGLILSWVFALWLINWLPTFVLATPGMNQTPLQEGFPVCLIAMIAGCSGIALAELSWNRQPAGEIGAGSALSPGCLADPLDREEQALLRVGLPCYFITMAGFGWFPGFAAVLSNAANLLVIFVAWKLRRGIARGLTAQTFGWLLGGLLFPIATTTFVGFIGYGVASSMLVLTHQISTLRRRVWAIPLGAVAVFLALSVFMTYMRDRDAIRDQVWGRQPIAGRLGQLVETFSAFETFSVEDPRHQEVVSARLDQVSIVGHARRNLELGFVEYARGETFVDAILAVIPRVLWPEKQIAAGSRGLVSRFTGLEFGPNTSVGVTQVLEGYINFGIPGVVAMFALLGFFLARADAVAGKSLENRDLSMFVAATLPAIAVLNVGGSMVETSASAAAGFLIAWVLRWLKVLSPLRPASVWSSTRM